MSIIKHSYTGETFSNLFNGFNPKEKKQENKTSMLKVASNCVGCPLFGTVSVDVCNSCKNASGISFLNNETYIKCSANENQSSLKKEASSVQGLHWENGDIATQENYDKAKGDIQNNVINELKYAAHEIGVKLAQSHVEDFSKMAENDSLSGKKLEKAAKHFVSAIREKLSSIQPTERNKNSGKIDEIFSNVTKNAKTILSGVSDPSKMWNSGGGKNMGSVVNPNTIWDSEALTKSAQTPSSDEITASKKEKIELEKKKYKASYWNALQEKLSEKGLVSSAKVHSTSTIEKTSFNSKLPENAMSLFGENKEFKNIPEKTAGEMLSEQNKLRANKKSEENKIVQIKAAKTVESNTWLFK